jgi:alkylation response protein AidB-like acyl-CoA dehydrogenase
MVTVRTGHTVSSGARAVVSARVSGGQTDTAGIGLFLVDANADGVKRRGYQTVDGLRAAEIHLDGVQVGADAVLGEPGAAYPAIEEVTGRAIAALCAEAVGAMEAACQWTLEYLNQRKQFGVPIGKFQALQHRMVDMQMHTEQARSMAILAASRLDEDRELRERTLSAAKALIGQAGRFVAEQSIQLHGGIGMTWEFAVAHYAKRLVMIDHVLGDTDHHIERYVALTDGESAGEAAGAPLAANA